MILIIQLMRNIVIAIMEVLLLLSGGFLIYMAISRDIQPKISFRFYIFALEHIYSFLMLFYYMYALSEEDLASVRWFAIFTFGNFFIFGAAQLYLSTKVDSSIDLASNQLLSKDFGIVGYIHFYYQVNIYFGVFSVFSIVMYILVRAHDHNEQEKIEQILEKLQENAYEITGNEEPCSICLGQYGKQESVYQLSCNHLFHKDCLKDWLKQKLNCPLCRNNLYEGQEN